MSRPAILDRVRAAGFSVWDRDRRDWNLNLIAVRRPDGGPVGYRCALHCVYRMAGEWVAHRWPCTTVPHLHFLQHPLHTDGTAVLVPGQHRGHWHLGHHPSPAQYTLVQDRARGPLPVWRDANRDGTVDRGGKVWDAYGINVHSGSASAGCIVLPVAAHREELVEICMESREVWGEHFTITLLEEGA